MQTILGMRGFGVLALLCLLSACGGGGGSNSSTDTAYPLDSAMSAFFQARHDYILTASSGSDHYTYVRGWTPGPMKSFQGISAFTTAQSAALSDNGSSISNDVQTKFFLIGPYKPIGGIDLGNGAVFVDMDQHALPALASVGDSGKFDTGTTYTDASLSKVQQTYVETWDLTAITADKAMLCFELATTIPNGSTTPPTVTNGALCYIMDQRGNITAIQESVELNGQQLIFK